MIRHDCGARDGRGGQGALARHPGHDRPGDRGRLLLRLRAQRAVHARRPRARSRRACARSCARDEPFRREVVSRDEARRRFEALGERYKAELIDAIPADEPITLYRQGDWFDLCRGPHVPSTGRIGAFKLTKVAGAYWRGDSRNAMLQRIYGTAWAEPEAARRLSAPARGGRAARPPAARPRARPVPLPGGGGGRRLLAPQGLDALPRDRGLLRRRLEAAGYVEVRTPQLLDRALWEASGHWEKFGEHMFTLEAEHKTLALKPMNCPAHVQIFNQRLHSYRDLPLRMAEFGSCHRNEPSGALHGLMRVRAFTQDDAHIFCTPSRSPPRSMAFCDAAAERSIATSASTSSRSGSPTGRRCAPAATRSGTGPSRRSGRRSRRAGLETTLNPGEGAFYGPKLEFMPARRDRPRVAVRHPPGRLRAARAARAPATSARTASKHRPVMLHRAILGSMERFIGILIEHHAGSLPLWLAPVQAVVATITNDSRRLCAARSARALAEAGHPPRARPRQRQDRLQGAPALARQGAADPGGRRSARPSSARSRCAGSASRRKKPLLSDEAVALFVDEARPPDLA